MLACSAIAAARLPFVSGYYLAYLFRSINALTASRLAADLHLGAADLGLLTSAYFFTFAAMQLPIGIALDRFGPRRVQAVLLPIGAAGAALLADSEQFAYLLLGRALLGLGFAGALMAGLKALTLWYPRERLSLANGCFVMIGALGAVTATAPVEMLLGFLSWRTLFFLLALATLASAVALLLLSPRDMSPARAGRGADRSSLRDVFLDPRFWRIAPLSATMIGTAYSMQGLWAAAWLTDVAHLDRATMVRDLSVMALGVCGGALGFGIVTDRLRRRGVRPSTILCGVAMLSIAGQAAIILRAPIPPVLPWLVMAAVASGTVVSYAAVAESFPAEIAGRANSAMNVLHIGGAFLIQTGIGLAIGLWSADAAGRYPEAAYMAAFALNLIPQVLALGWFALSHAGQAWTAVGASGPQMAVRCRP